MKKRSKNLMGGVAMMMIAAGGAGPAMAATFTVDDIVNNKIQFDYNARENIHYLNGTQILGSTFATTVDSYEYIHCNGGDGLVVDDGKANAGLTRSFAYSFILPADTYISGLSVHDRFTTFDGSGLNNQLQLWISKDNVTYDLIDFMTSANGTVKDEGETLNLTSYVLGAPRYYIKGVYNFTAGTGSDFPGTLQMFRTDGTGAAACVFTNTISVVPEPASLALLLGVGGLLAARRRR
ncbi:MAG: PEP-CTERM sorting domain-containing protein [Lentisphaeria bacterium]